MSEGAGEGSGRATGVEPGALSALLQEIAATPEKREEEPAALPPGTVLGRYEIVRELGRGGFGVVYEAKDRDLGRQVAVKVVRPGRIAEEEGRVSREAEAIARLAHPNLVTLHDLGRSEHGPYLVFELLRGKTLDLRIEEGSLPVQEAVHVATEVARGLAHAHAEGVIHRDLKPANVFVTGKGQVKILDFGMAHAFGRRRLSGGTPAYMAPEQWEDDPEDERTDVFALGVMLYRMLTGEYPFPEGKGKWSADAATPRRLEVPGAPELADLVERMLDRVPKGRPRDGAAVLAALAPIDDRLRARPADGKPPEHARRRKATVGDLLAELRRRHVFRVMVGYGVFAFAVLQVTEPVMHGADLPNWVLKAVLVLLALGFPVAVILAWVYDLTAQGVKRTPSASGPEAPSFGRSRFLVPLATSAVLLVIAAVGAGGWQAWRRAQEPRGDTGARATSPSIAVLPFEDLSPDRDQEAFSDGVAEEVLGALSRLKGLRVPGRASSFWFKGRGTEPAEIARRLGVTYLLSGSVRRSGDRLRISAEVLRAADGERLWSQTFERQIADVFAVQDDIARSVVSVLKMRLLPGQEVTTREHRPANPGAYESYLLGKHLLRGGPKSNERALAALRTAITLDPGFAPAWVELSRTWLKLGKVGGATWADARREALAASTRAVELAPDLPEARAARASARLVDWDWGGARVDAERALQLGPDDLAAIRAMAHYAGWMGRTEEELALAQRVVDLDPLLAGAWEYLGAVLVDAGRLAEAEQANVRALELEPASPLVPFNRMMIALLSGRASEALSMCPTSGAKAVCEAMAYHALGDARRSQEAIDRMLAVHERGRPEASHAYVIATAQAFRGSTDSAFEWLETARAGHAHMLNTIQTDPVFRKLHSDPRWAELLGRMNLPVAGAAPLERAAPFAAAPSIAVLPFADMSPKHDQEYFADGVAEEIRNALAHVQGLKVIGRTSSLAFKDKADDVQAIGQKLGVANVLEGSLRKDGNAVRVTAQLIRVSDGAHLWSEKYDGRVASVFEVQEGIAKAVAGALKVKLLAGKGTDPISHRAVNVEAYRLHLLARSILGPETPEARRRAIETWERAARVDPGYALPHVFLAINWNNLAYSAADPAEARRLEKRARAELERALELDPGEGAAYGLRAWWRMDAWDWAGARRDLDQAEALNADRAVVYNSRARLLGAAGRHDEAVAAQRRTLEVEPLAAVFHGNLVHHLLAAGRLDEAREAARRALEISPKLDVALEGQAVLDLLQGRPEAALLGFQGIQRPAPVRLRNLAVANHALGRERESMEALAELERDHPGERFLIAGVHARRGDRDGAFRWLEKAAESGDADLTWMNLSWPLRSLRGDPRYVELLRKMNLPVD